MRWGVPYGEPLWWRAQEEMARHRGGSDAPVGRGFAVSRRGWVLFTMMSVIWGVPYLLIKVADGGVAVPVLVFARVAIGAAVLLPLAIRRGQIRVLGSHWRWLAAFAVVEIMVQWALLSYAERHLSSS